MGATVRDWRLPLCWLAFMSTQRKGGSWRGIHGSLNENGPHRLIGSSILGGCDFVGVGVDFLKKMYHWGEWTLRF